MAKTLDYYCARVESAKDLFMSNPRALNVLLDAIDEMKAARVKIKQERTNENTLFK